MRVDPLIIELAATITNNNNAAAGSADSSSTGAGGGGASGSSGSSGMYSNALRGSALEALAVVISKSLDKITPVGLEKATAVVVSVVNNPSDENDETIKNSVAKVAAAISVSISPAQTTDILLDIISSAGSSTSANTPPSSGSGSGAHSSNINLPSKLLAASAIVQYGGAKCSEVKDEVIQAVLTGMKDERATVRVAACMYVIVFILLIMR